MVNVMIRLATALILLYVLKGWMNRWILNPRVYKYIYIESSLSAGYLVGLHIQSREQAFLKL